MCFYSEYHKGNFSTSVPLIQSCHHYHPLPRRPVHLRTQQKIFGCEGLAALPRDSLYHPAKNARGDGATGTLPDMNYSLQ